MNTKHSCPMVNKGFKVYSFNVVYRDTPHNLCFFSFLFSDLNMLETMSRQRRSSPGMGTSGGPRGDGPGGGGQPGRGPSPAHSPYSPSSRGQSPALTKRGMGSGGTTGGGGGNVVGVTTHSSSIPNSLSEASSYENLQTPDQGKYLEKSKLCTCTFLGGN